MKDNNEIRKSAKKALKGRWFGRVLLVGMVLQIIVNFVSGAQSVIYRHYEIETLQNFMLAKLRAIQSGIDYTVPSSKALWRLVEATSFQMFILYIFTAIFTFGIITVMLKAVKNDENRWFASSFGGFARPLELLWLVVVMNIRTALWSLLFIVPGIVAIYRYRQAWYVKCENVEKSAGECIRESAKLMQGHKWQAFRLDAWYFVSMFMSIIVLAIVVQVGGQFEGNVISCMVSFLVCCLACYWVIRLLIQWFAARTIFYQEVMAIAQFVK